MATEKQYLEAIGTYAVKMYSQKKILPSLPMAQAILETGHFKSTLFTKAYNLSGMKYSKGCGTDKIRMITSEYYSSITAKKLATTYGMTINEVCTLNKCSATSTLKGYVKVYDYFRKYKTLEEGLGGFYAFYGYSRYANLKGVKDPKKCYELIQKDGWATSPTYTTTLMSVYNSNKELMNKYDKIALSKECTIIKDVVLRSAMRVEKATEITTIKKGTKGVRVLAVMDKWLKVWYNGKTAYIVKVKADKYK